MSKVNVTFYYGTKYDYINIPYNTSSIASSATKSLTPNKAQITWQTQWLTEIRISGYTYSDIEGMQYAKITDSDTNKVYWYNVIGYNQIAKKTVTIGLYYDPLLTIGVNSISSIHGFLQRWSVNDDTHFKYTFSSEPIDQIAPYSMGSYTNFNLLTEETPNYNLVGFPVNMNVEPEIAVYENTESEDTYIYYPKMELGIPTVFSTTMPDYKVFYDGLLYYDWNSATTTGTPKYNYNNAVGLGYDLVTNAYVLPANELTTLSKLDTDSTDKFSNVAGSSTTKYFSSYQDRNNLWVSGYNNNKAGEIGLFYTLFNAFTGDSVTVNNYELDDKSVIFFVNPYVNGCFYARFGSYLHDSSLVNMSGLVKSCGWQPMTVTSSSGQGAISNAISNYISQDVLSVQSQNVNRSATANIGKAAIKMVTDFGQSSLNTLSRMDERDFDENDLFSALGGQMISAAATIAPAIIDYKTAINNLNNSINQQRNALYYEGTIGRNTPPDVKYAQANVFSSESYTFYVRTVSLSSTDRLRADRFFTAYGYNVNNAILNSVSQLNTRSRFTFIQADDVEITSTVSGVQFRDNQTIEYIKNRFSGGLRIWQVTPDYDWSVANPIRR